MDLQKCSKMLYFDPSSSSLSVHAAGFLWILAVIVIITIFLERKKWEMCGFTVVTDRTWLPEDLCKWACVCVCVCIYSVCVYSYVLFCSCGNLLLWCFAWLKICHTNDNLFNYEMKKRIWFWQMETLQNP